MRFIPEPQNLLIRAAFAANRMELDRKLRHIVFPAGQEFFEYEALPRYLVFPVRGIVSVQVLTDPGKPVEIGLVGREGFAEVSQVFGPAKTRMATVALTAGEAVLMKPQVFRTYLEESKFRKAVEAYARFFMVMLGQLSACNRVHIIEKTCIVRLLLMQDRMQDDSFDFTQDALSRMLGVRRASVGQALAGLQRKGAIRYDRRGHLRILNRSELEKLASPCYRVIKDEFDQFMKSQGGY